MTRSIGALNLGVQKLALSETQVAAGTSEVELSLETDSILVTLFVTSVAVDLTVNVWAITDDAHTKEVVLFSFPSITGPTTNLLLKRAAVSTQRVLIEAVYTGAVEYEIYARAIMAGLSDARIIPPGSLRMEHKDITTGAPQVLIPSSLVDRAGVLVKNWNGGNLYIGESPSAATLVNGYPLAPKDALAMDIQSGVSIYGVAESTTVDVRIVEVGG